MYGVVKMVKSRLGEESNSLCWVFAFEHYTSDKNCVSPLGQPFPLKEKKTPRILNSSPNSVLS